MFKNFEIVRFSYTAEKQTDKQTNKQTDGLEHPKALMCGSHSFTCQHTAPAFTA